MEWSGGAVWCMVGFARVRCCVFRRASVSYGAERYGEAMVGLGPPCCDSVRNGSARNGMERAERPVGSGADRQATLLSGKVRHGTHW